MIWVFCGNRYGVNWLDLEEAMDRVLVELLGERIKDPYASEVFFADDTQNPIPPIERILQGLQGGDLFGGGEDKVLIVRNCDALAESQIVELAEFLMHQKPTVPLLLEGQKFFRDDKKASKAAAAWAFFRKQAKVYEFPAVAEWKTSEWLQKRADKYGFKLKTENAHFMIETSGSDTQVLDAELRKIRLHSPQVVDLNYELLDQLLARSNAGSYSELQKQFGLGQRETFLAHWERMGSERSEWIGLLAGLFGHCVILSQGAELLKEGVRSDVLPQELGIAPGLWKARQYAAQAVTRSPLIWRKILLQISEAMHQVTTGELISRYDLECRLLTLFPIARN
jgi:DNA polymerase III delta subunit